MYEEMRRDLTPHSTLHACSSLRSEGSAHVQSKGLIDTLKLCYRAPLEELWRNMKNAKDGEYACCGVFTPTFLNGLTRGDQDIDKNERAAILKVLKVVGAGTREILRAHAETDQVGNAIHLNQRSITSFFALLPVTTGTDEGNGKDSNKEEE